MMRSFLTRLVDSVTRTVLLVPCLLICLACATPFPFESLEEGMTADTVRERFGDPEAMEGWPVTRACWSYKHEERIFLLFPLAPITSGWCVLIGLPWHCIWVDTSMVLLDFQEEKLVGWEVHSPSTPAPASAKESPPPAWQIEAFLDPPTCESVRAQGTWTYPGENYCINQCMTDHNACVAESTEAGELESCNTEIRSCACSCRPRCSVR